MEYSDLVKNFETVREYLRDFYLFGFKTRNDFTRNSARKYDNERRRAEDWLCGAMSFHTNESGRSYFISADSRVIPENPLYRAFKNKSFTDYDISLHFHILDALGDGKEHSLRQTAESISGRWQAVPGAPDIPDDATIRNKLNEYVRLGILRSRREKRSLLYCLRPPLRNMKDYLDAVSFASETLPLGVIGSFMLDAQGHTQKLFSYKHRYLPGVLDSEVLLALIECKNLNKCARITRRSLKNNETATDLVFPLRFFFGTQTGRDYLLAWALKEKRMHAYRMDRIIRVASATDEDPEITAADFPIKRITAMADELQKHLWGVALGKKVSDSNLQQLSATIRVEPGESYIVQRLRREKRCGTVTQTDESTWRFDAEVHDALEMLPWLRTFTGRILSLTCSNPEVTKRFHDDVAAMLQLYGDDCDAV